MHDTDIITADRETGQMAIAVPPHIPAGAEQIVVKLHTAPGEALRARSAMDAPDHIKPLIASVLALPGDDQISFLEYLPADLVAEFAKRAGMLMDQVEVTPEIALHFLNTTQYGLQRSKKSKHVKRLASTMKEGGWLPESIVQFAHCKEDNRVYLIDGQHRFHAVVLSGTTQKFRILPRHFDTLEQVKIAYTVIDNGSKRSTRDQLKALLFSDPDYTAQDISRLGVIKSALSVLLNGFQITSARSEDAVDMGRLTPLLKRFDTATKVFQQAVDGSAIAKRCMSSPILSLGIVLCDHETSCDLAVKFFAAVGAASDVTAETATGPVRIARYIIDNTRTDAHGVGVLSRMLAACWNAYAGKEPLKEIPSPENFSHLDLIKIKKTPFSGVQKVKLTMEGTFVTEQTAQVVD